MEHAVLYMSTWVHGMNRLYKYRDNRYQKGETHISTGQTQQPQVKKLHSERKKMLSSSDSPEVFQMAKLDCI